MPYLELSDAVPLYYEEHGAGRPVLLLHGWTMNGSFWSGNIAALAAENRVIVADFRGHGRSGKTAEGHSLDQYARDVRELVLALGLDEVTMVGWSMGTSVVLSYVRQFGCEGLRGAVFVDQSPRFMDGPGWDFALQGGYSPVDLAVFAQTVRHARPLAIKPFIAACFAEPPAAEAVDAAYAETTQTHTASALDVWMDMAHSDWRPVLPAVKVPTLLIYGERSRIFPGDLAGWLAQALPDARVERFAASGHVPFVEEGERFDAVVTEFLRR
ncbi:alpha/beta hydrolase [Embleya sp. NBC_00888]|uniref:alpha/beta fold hydrolase n=1 Tax=Embleya sp. NBC_00888 TaxID=2975960 RepID=UPI003868F81C|nr:alpha/beta hydrolase [Embleya sp. NBC_00888]